MVNEAWKKIVLLMLLLTYPIAAHYEVSYSYADDFLGEYSTYAPWDFPTFYFAARLVREGKSPYDYELLSKAKTVVGVFVFPYLYPPPSLLLFYPMSLIKYHTAKVLMWFFNYALAILSLYLILFKILRLDVRRYFTWLALLYAAFYTPIRITFHSGQTNMIILFLISLAWYALKKDGHPAATALPLSVAITVKPSMLLLVLYLAARRRYNAVSWTLGLLAFYSAISFVLLPSAWADWLTKVLPLLGYGIDPFNCLQPSLPVNQGINGFFMWMFIGSEVMKAPFHSPAAARVLAYAVSGLALAVSVWLLHRPSKGGADSGGRTDVEFSFVLATMYLVSPLSWDHHLVFMLPAVVLALQLSLNSKGERLWFVAVAVSAVLISWDPIYHKFMEAELVGEAGFLTLIMAKFSAIVLIWLYYAKRLRKPISAGLTPQEGQQPSRRTL